MAASGWMDGGSGAASSLADREAVARRKRERRDETRRFAVEAAQICSSLIGFWFCKLKNAETWTVGRRRYGSFLSICFEGRQETGRKEASSSAPLIHSLPRSSWRCSTPSFRRPPAPARFINGSFSLSVFPSRSPFPTLSPSSAAAGCKIECHGLKTALENVSIVNCSRRSYKMSRRRSPQPPPSSSPSRSCGRLPASYVPRTLASFSQGPSSVRLSVGKKGRWGKIFHASYAREVWPMKL